MVGAFLSRLRFGFLRLIATSIGEEVDDKSSSGEACRVDCSLGNEITVSFAEDMFFVPDGEFHFSIDDDPPL